MVSCQYCGNEAKLVGGDVIYRHRPDLAAKQFYHCAPCQAYVGCHPGTTQSLGILANARLRSLKSQVHAAFDPLWKGGGLRRASAYHWLSTVLEIKPQECHIGMFTEERCEQALRLIASRKLSETAS